MENQIVQYIRNKKGERIGVIVAKRTKDMVHIGWSLTKVSAGDKFNRELGLKIAIKRAESERPLEDQTTGKKIPNSIKGAIKAMHLRASKYFKDAEVRAD